MKMKTVFKTSVACIVFFCFSTILRAQGPGGPGDGGGDPDPAPPADGTSAPFDFRIGILVVAGVAYAIKRKLDSKTQVDYNTGK
jgi:hypothetical protein